FLDAERSRGHRLFLIRLSPTQAHDLHLDLIAAEPGALRNRPRALRDPRGVPRDRQLVLLIAALMTNLERARTVSRRRHGEAAQILTADHVLHRDALTGPEERAIQHGLDVQRALPVVGRQIEPPRLDSLLPARVNEREIVSSLRGNEESAAQIADRLVPFGVTHLALRRGLARWEVRGPRRPQSIRHALPDRPRMAIPHRHARASNRLRLVERRDPDERAFPAPL